MAFGVQFQCKRCGGRFEDLSQHACKPQPKPIATYHVQKDQLKASRNKGGRPSLGEPWLKLGVSRRAYFYRKKAGKL